MDVEPVRNPFMVLIDTAESQPWTFQGLKADADKDEAPLHVPYRFEALGRHPNSLGDYSIEGFYGRVAVERKSHDDAISTVLGWNSKYEVEHGLDGRRERFKRELENLAGIQSGIVIVESAMEQILLRMPGSDGDRYDLGGGECNPVRGKKTVAENRKSFFRSVVSWQQRYKVNWAFCSSRRAAEVFAFRWLEKFWQHLDAKERRKALLDRHAGAV